MGRGRAKAKQTKVARELKYSSHHMDLSALQRELSGDSRSGDGSDSERIESDEYDDDGYDDYRR
jgi:hypothetical protein